MTFQNAAGWTVRTYIVGICGLCVFLQAQSQGLAGPAALALGFAWTIAVLFSKIHGVFVIPVAVLSMTFGVAGIVLSVLAAGASALEREKKKETEYGKGGSAAWASGKELRDMQYDPNRRGAIFLGKSLREDTGASIPIGVHGEGHLMTVAGTGAGKGTSLVTPNLIEYKGSVISLDPKGENAEATARARAKRHGQRVRVVDPYEQVGGPARKFRVGFNPMAEIDPRSAMARDHIETLSECSIPREAATGNNQYWVDTARLLFGGVVAHVLTTEPPERRHLPRVKELLMTRGDRLWQEMARNPTCGGIAMSAADVWRQASPPEWSGLINTVRQWTEWIASPPMARLLKRSDFSMRELTDGGQTSIYIVLPPHLMRRYMAFMRIVVALALEQLTKARAVRQTHPVLFLLDEFPVLGHFERMADAIAVGRGYQAKLWLILQDLSQLNANYGELAQTFQTNANILTAFGVKDVRSAGVFSQMLGDHIIEEPTESITLQKTFWGHKETGRTRSTVRSRVPLLKPEEVSNYTAPRTRRMLVLRNEKPIRLERVPYWERFSRWQYDRNRGFRGF